MGGLCRKFLFATLVVAVPLSSYSSDATGSLRFTSCEPMRWYRLTLTRFRNQNLKNAIALELPADWVLLHLTDEWLDVIGGLECAPDGSCATVTGKVRNVRFHGWRGSAISGDFIVQFLDGSKLQGSFNAKYVKPPAKIICE